MTKVTFNLKWPKWSNWISPSTHSSSFSLPPSSSAGKESTCNTGDPGSTPGLGNSPGERIDYPLQYSWSSLVVQMVKNPPAMWFPGGGHGKSLQCSCLKNPHGQRSLVGYSPRGHKESDTIKPLNTHWLLFLYHISLYSRDLKLCCLWKLLSHVRLFVTPWTIQSMEFSRQEY